jgi:hypothetical protein
MSPRFEISQNIHGWMLLSTASEKEEVTRGDLIKVLVSNNGGGREMSIRDVKKWME